VAVAEHTIELAGAPVFYRSAPAREPTPVYVHSLPTSSDDWLPFLARTGGLAPDLLGFGRSGKGGHLEYTLPACVDFLEGVLQAADAQEIALVGHGFGAAVALGLAQRRPERVRKLVLIDALPVLEDYSWPRAIQRVRRPAVGELVMGSITRRLLARGLRSGAVDPGAFSQERLNKVWTQFDQGTQRAILRLLRGLDAKALADAGAGLGELEIPALVLWGDRDPWLPARLAQAYADRLPHAEVEIVSQAGHWPWLDRPEVIDRVVAFLE
jgi:pimeloyl-ACP methyl ester carboxylesterase